MTHLVSTGRDANPEGKWPQVSLLSLFLNGLATVQIVWVYLLHVPSALNIAAFENGTERTPFQYRLLMLFPLRWAHSSHFMAVCAAALQRMHGWLPSHVSTEAVVQFLVDLLCLASTGFVVRVIYLAASRTRILGPFVYPLTLILVLFSYTFLTTHAIRFVYDFPSLAFFSVGLYLIYFRRHSAWFVLLFLVATLNRETSLLLLPLYAVTQCVLSGPQRKPAQRTLSMRGNASFNWTRMYAPRSVAVILPLAAFWIGWHLWLVHHFARNPSAAGPRLLLNLALLLCPLSWPQVASACGFLCPIVFVYKNRIDDPTLRLWIWLLPAWLVFMFIFGLLIEPRVFGELIPLTACTSALIAEKSMLRKLGIAGAPRILPFKVRRFS